MRSGGGVRWSGKSGPNPPRGLRIPSQLGGRESQVLLRRSFRTEPEWHPLGRPESLRRVRENFFAIGAICS